MYYPKLRNCLGLKLRNELVGHKHILITIVIRSQKYIVTNVTPEGPKTILKLT